MREKNEFNLIKKIAAGTGLVALLSTPLAANELPIPKEPMSREKVKAMYLCAPSKQFIIEYDLDGDGRVDYKTGRLSYSSQRGPNHFHAVFEKEPFMYYVDLNKDYHFDVSEIFVDETQDGVNGNELSYSDYRGLPEEEKI